VTQHQASEPAAPEERALQATGACHHAGDAFMECRGKCRSEGKGLQRWMMQSLRSQSIIATHLQAILHIRISSNILRIEQPSFHLSPANAAIRMIDAKPARPKKICQLSQNGQCHGETQTLARAEAGFGCNARNQ